MDIILPSLSAGMQSGVIARWRKSVGDDVKEGEPLAEVETDKQGLELIAEASGFLKSILISPGQNARVHQTIAELTLHEAAAVTNASSVAPVISRLSSATSSFSRPRITASPLARRIAFQNGIDLFSLAGSGPGGRIVKRDLQARGVTLRTAFSQPARDSIPKLTADQLAMLGEEAARSRDSGELRLLYETVIEVDALLSLLDEISAICPANSPISFADLFVRASAVVLAQSAPTFRNIALLDRTTEGFRKVVISDAADKTVSTISAELQNMREQIDGAPACGGDDQVDVFAIHACETAGVSLSIFGAVESVMLSLAGRERCAVARGEDLMLATVVRCELSIGQRANNRINGSELLRTLRETIEKPFRIFV